MDHDTLVRGMVTPYVFALVLAWSIYGLDLLLTRRSKKMKVRAKMKVSNVNSGVGCDTLTFHAVSKSTGYPADGADEDNDYARWTPSASLTMTVSNPDLVGKFAPGDTFYVDLTKID